MIKIIEDSEIEDMIFKDNYILIMCKKLSAEIIKKLARTQHKVGIYYRNGFVLDTVNGAIAKVNKNENCSYELKIYALQENMLKGINDYEMFYNFLQLRQYFKKYYRISLYWDETQNECIYEKTTPLDKWNFCSLDFALNSIRQINVNTKIFKKIKFTPNLQDTLNSFVDKTEVGEYYKDEKE